jgi:hypothetical protein
MQTRLRWRQWCGSAFGGSLESDGGFCVGAFGRNLASVAVKMYSHQLTFNKFYKFCSTNAICKHNAAISCITVQHKKAHSCQVLWVASLLHSTLITQSSTQFTNFNLFIQYAHVCVCVCVCVVYV